MASLFPKFSDMDQSDKVLIFGALGVSAAIVVWSIRSRKRRLGGLGECTEAEEIALRYEIESKFRRENDSLAKRDVLALTGKIGQQLYRTLSEGRCGDALQALVDANTVYGRYNSHMAMAGNAAASREWEEDIFQLMEAAEERFVLGCQVSRFKPEQMGPWERQKYYQKLKVWERDKKPKWLLAMDDEAAAEEELKMSYARERDEIKRKRKVSTVRQQMKKITKDEGSRRPEKKVDPVDPGPVRPFKYGNFKKWERAEQERWIRFRKEEEFTEARNRAEARAKMARKKRREAAKARRSRRKG